MSDSQGNQFRKIGELLLIDKWDTCSSGGGVVLAGLDQAWMSIFVVLVAVWFLVN